MSHPESPAKITIRSFGVYHSYHGASVYMDFIRTRPRARCITNTYILRIFTAHAQLQDMATRGTVVLLGKRGTGKSTIANVIYGGEDELRRTESHRLFTVRSSTTSLWCAITILKPPGDDATYHITVIDTPGFFDTNSKISNKKIIEDLRKYFIENIPDGVSLVIFVMRKNRFTQEDQDVFDFLRESLSEQIGGISALLITHCDCECASERKRFLETFKSGKESGKVAKFMGKGVYTVGFPDLSTTRETLIPMLKEDIEVVRKLVYESSGAFILAKEMFIEKNRKWFLGKCYILSSYIFSKYKYILVHVHNNLGTCVVRLYMTGYHTHYDIYFIFLLTR